MSGPYYRTLKRNERIIALYLQELSPKEISLKPEVAGASLWVIYKVIKKFHMETFQSSPITQMEIRSKPV